MNPPRNRPSFIEHLHPPSIPAEQARFRYTLGLGGLSLFFFMVSAVSGALLLFYYSPDAANANASIQLIQYHVPFGWLVRGLHYWSSQALVVAAGLHLLRVALTGGFRAGRGFNWLLGLGLFLVLLAANFTGYGLRWDRAIGPALLVGTNLLRLVPLLGDSLYAAAVGGAQLGEASLLRLYGWHVFGLMLPAAILVVWHLFRLRRDGGIAHSPSAGQQTARIARRELVRRELLAMLWAGAGLVVAASLAPPALQGPLDPVQLSADASAPWFFLWVQELLRLGDPTLMGIGLPLAVLLLFALIPYGLDRGLHLGRWLPADGRLVQSLVIALSIAWLSLTLMGALR